jgi:hypothetical protein
MNALQSGQPLSFQQALLGGRTGLSAFELQQGQLEAQRKRAEAERLQRAVPFAVAAQRAVNTPVESLEESDALLSGARQELASLGISSPEINGKFASLQLLGTPEARREGLMTLVSSIPGLEEMLTAQSQKRADVEKTDAETRKLNLQAGQVGRPQQFAPPEIVRLMAERDALPKGSPARAELQKRIEALGTPRGTTVKVNTGEKIEEKANIESAVKEQDRVRAAAQTARRTLVSVDSSQRVLDSGFQTGFGTEVKATAAAFLGALGVKDAENFATNAQTFLKAAMDQVLARQIEQRGVQTNQDAQRMLQTYADLGNTPAANRFVVALTRAQANQAIEQDDFYRKWKKENDTIQGAEDAWLEQQGNKSIFERPELKQYALKKETPATAGGPVRLPKDNADEVYNSLPSGTVYIDPNGVQKRKR